MLLNFKKLAKTIITNGFLLIALIISIQNSNIKTKVNLLIFETVDLPISFIVGVTFISGSIIGELLQIAELTGSNKSS